MSSERIDILALAPLPLRSNGGVAFQVGATLQCAWLLAGLARLGHGVRALAVGPPQPHELEPGDLGPDVPVDWFAVEMLRTMSPPTPEEVGRRREQFTSALDRAIAERRPDLVILGNESHPWYAADPCRDRGLPTVLVAQGVPTAALPSGIYPPPALRALTEELTKLNLIVAVSREVEAILRGLGLTRVRTIETGTDVRAFRPLPKDPDLLARYDIGRDRFVVGSFAHMRAEKRVADVVRSAKIVTAEEPRAVYLVGGDGALRDELAAMVSEAGLGESFRFIGELPHDGMPAHLALCDVVIVASEREGYSLVAREAQAAGSALVMSDIPAGRAATVDGAAGLTFKVGDAVDLAAKTLALARDGGLRRKFAARGREAVLASGADGWVSQWSDAVVAAARG